MPGTALKGLALLSASTTKNALCWHISFPRRGYEKKIAPNYFVVALNAL